MSRLNIHLGEHSRIRRISVPLHKIASLLEQLFDMLTTVNFSDPGKTADIFKEDKTVKLRIRLLESQLEIQKA